MNRKILMIILLLITMASSGHAQDGDIQAGKAKSAGCAGCHGPDGNSLIPQFPNLAGQVPGYIAQQLFYFKKGTRIDQVMLGMVAALSTKDMQDLDAYYASLPAKSNATTPVPSIEAEAEIKAGGKIYRGGFRPYKISACMGCHGPSGHGIPPNFPHLSGQPTAYIEKQLFAFKNGSRNSEVMNPIAFTLSAQQIKQLALYISRL